MSVERCPVSDWSTDFDHTDPVWVADPYPIWDELRSECPMARSERYGGTWLPTSHELVSAIAYDTENYTSRGVIVSPQRPDEPAPVGPAPPITSDPPFHQIARRLLLPAFAPKAVEKWRPYTEALCARLLDDIEARAAAGEPIDTALDYTQHIPVGVIAGMLGLPEEDGPIFRDFIHRIIEDLGAHGEEVPHEETIDFYLDNAIAKHIEDPQDNLLEYLLNVEIEGMKLQPEHVRGTVILLIIAGIDTTWSAIGSMLWHLAHHPDDCARLVAEPELRPTAIEEFLRAYGPVTMARLVARDHEQGGRQLKEGDWVLLPFPAANRDPEMFDDADRVVIDRAVNRHSAFGLGIHRCIGSNLARMEMAVALDAWLDRFGTDFSLADPDAVTWSAGQVRGPRSIPMTVGA